MIEYRSTDGRLVGDLSAYRQIVTGLGDATEFFKGAEKLGMSPEDSRRFAETINQGLADVQGRDPRVLYPRRTARPARRLGGPAATGSEDSPGWSRSVLAVANAAHRRVRL